MNQPNQSKASSADFEAMKVTELKLLCKEKGVQKYYKMNKSQMILALKQYSKDAKKYDEKIKLDIKPIEKTKDLDIKIELLSHLKKMSRTITKKDKWEYEEEIKLQAKLSSDIVPESVIEPKMKTKKITYLIQSGTLYVISTECSTEFNAKPTTGICAKSESGESMEMKNTKIFVVENTIEMWNEIIQYLKEVIYNFGEWLEIISVKITESKGESRAKTNVYKSDSKSDKLEDSCTDMSETEMNGNIEIIMPHTGELYQLNKPSALNNGSFLPQSISLPHPQSEENREKLDHKQKSRPLFLGRMLPSKLNSKNKVEKID